jgi:hypothetical protein
MLATGFCKCHWSTGYKWAAGVSARSKLIIDLYAYQTFCFYLPGKPLMEKSRDRLRQKWKNVKKYEVSLFSRN